MPVAPPQAANKSVSALRLSNKANESRCLNKSVTGSIKTPFKNSMLFYSKLIQNYICHSSDVDRKFSVFALNKDAEKTILIIDTINTLATDNVSQSQV
ncbi:hypothetical protein KDK_20040 [Dictyobacter kobayashii]|uniref:Uncharacterized protein n=1 Tax=Dictyobacter kobayashii TaxID=2014872 RepID=A0A402AGM5_9CHLR|nr:hypothetical protein KDK_20040 [Dictyobacter kobayashii]